jgi:hypothetical protein
MLLAMLSLLAQLSAACQLTPSENAATETPSIILPAFSTAEAGAAETQAAQLPGSDPSGGPPVGVRLGRRIHFGDVDLKIPRDWYKVEVSLDHLDSLLFMEQDPNELAGFDDPDLAFPLDFKAGAILITNPDDVDSQEWQQKAAAGYATLDDDELVAMLLGLDQVGLINFAAVENARLESATLGNLGGVFALKLEGDIFFTKGTPPVLHVVIWLCRIDDRFLSYYATASEAVWPSSEATYEAVAETIQFR